MNGFESETLIKDIDEYTHVFQDFVQAVPADGWALRTGSRDKDWTLHQTLAHLVALAGAFNLGAEAAASRDEMEIEGLIERDDLRSWNESQIARLTQHPPAELAMELIVELERTAAIVRSLSPEEQQRSVLARVYARPVTAIQLLGWQLSHAGVIHAAQVTRPFEWPPLWEKYTADMMTRQLDRFIQHFGVAFWPEYMGDTPRTINLKFGDLGWHLTGSKERGTCDQGLAAAADFEAEFASAGVFFGLFTFHLSFREALESGQMKVTGDFAELMQLLRLYTPMRPT